ncbi:unnamed protein product [Ectocarpus fasciculatus]
MVGAAAVLSALYRAPLTGSLLLFELTKDYDIVLPLMAAAGVSSLVVELFSRADAPAVQPMPRDMSLEIGLKISGRVDKLMGKIQSLRKRGGGGGGGGRISRELYEQGVTDALVPRILALTADTPLSEAMRAFRLTRNEFAVVVSSSGFDTYQAPSDSSGGGDRGQRRLTGQTGTNGDTTDWHAETLLAEDLWERRDMKLVGVLALREIILALDRERASFSENEVRPELTAGSVCRQNCFTVKASMDIASAKKIMTLKAIRYLPVVVDLPLPPSPEPATATAVAAPPPPAPVSIAKTTATRAIAPFTRRRSNNKRRGDSAAGGESDGGNDSEGDRDAVQEAAVPPPPPPPPPVPKAVIGVLSRDSVRIASRLTETERAIWDRPSYSPPPPTPVPLSPLSPPPTPPTPPPPPTEKS